MVAWYESVEEGSQGKWPFKPWQVVPSDGRSSTGELLTNFCYIFTIIGVVTFIICFSLKEKYKEEVVKKYGEGFNYGEEPKDGRVVYDSGGRKAHRWWDRCIVLFNFMNVRYDTSYYCWLLFWRFALFDGVLDSREAMHQGEVRHPHLLVLRLVYVRYT